MFENSIIGKYTPETVKEIALNCTSMKQLAEQLGYSQNGGTSGKTISKYCEYYNISLEHFTNLPKEIVKRNPENVFIKNSTANQTTLRRWYEKGNYSEYKCSICGLEPFWNGKELTLTLDHINGDNRDDRLENLRWVCPNCDRQLDTFCSKNTNYDIRKNKKIISYCKDCGKEISNGAIRCIDCMGKSYRQQERPNPDKLKQILLEHNGNFSAVGKLYNVTDNSIRKWCKAYNMPYHSSDYKEK